MSKISTQLSQPLSSSRQLLKANTMKLLLKKQLIVQEVEKHKRVLSDVIIFGYWFLILRRRNGIFSLKA